MMNALLSFLIPHRDSPGINFRLRKQLPFIAMTTLSMLIMFSILLPLFIISTTGKITVFSFILITLIVMLCAAIVLLRKQKYNQAARLVSLTLFSSCMAVLFLMPYSGGIYEAYRPFAFMVTICTCNVLVSLEKKQIILFFTGTVAGWILVFLTIFRPFLVTSRSLTISIFFTCLLGLVIVNMVLLFIKNLSDDLLETAQKETEAAQAAFGNLTKVMQEARDGMAIGEQILDASSRVQKSIEEVEKIQIYLSGSSDSLVKESENFTISSGSVLDSARAMKDNLQEQNSAITETSAAITQISANLASISGIATNRRDMLTEITQAGKAQKELVKKLLDAVASVQKSSEGINVFVSLVQDVASRTGLLSMNASIEAARAGTSGKGFAVIAQEIRSLSEETQKNAGTIKTLLSDNEKTVESTNIMMKEFSCFIEKNVQYTSSLTESIDEILRGITEMDTGTREVMQAAQDIVTAAQDSNEMVNTVVSRVDSQKVGFSHIAGFSSELYQRIKLLDKSVKEIRSASDLVATAGRLNTEQVKKLQMHIND